MENLVKVFATGRSWSFYEGQIPSFLGPNGGGKSSTMWVMEHSDMSRDTSSMLFRLGHRNGNQLYNVNTQLLVMLIGSLRLHITVCFFIRLKCLWFLADFPLEWLLIVKFAAPWSKWCGPCSSILTVCSLWPLVLSTSWAETSWRTWAPSDSLGVCPQPNVLFSMWVWKHVFIISSSHKLQTRLKKGVCRRPFWSLKYGVATWKNNPCVTWGFSAVSLTNWPCSAGHLITFVVLKFECKLLHLLFYHLSLCQSEHYIIAGLSNKHNGHWCHAYLVVVARKDTTTARS